MMFGFYAQHVIDILMVDIPAPDVIISIEKGSNELNILFGTDARFKYEDVFKCFHINSKKIQRTDNPMSAVSNFLF